MRISDWSSDVCSSDLWFDQASVTAPAVGGDHVRWAIASPGTQTPAPPARHVDISIGMLRPAAAGMPAWRRPSAGARTPPRHTAFPGYAGSQTHPIPRPFPYTGRDSCRDRVG